MPTSTAAMPPFVSHCLELLAVLGPVRAKRMFGGWGLYAQDLFVALIAFDRLYLKTDAQTRPRFEAGGGEPFIYDMNGQPKGLPYWTVPDEAMDAPPLFEPWARLALQAAVAARALKPAPRPQRAAKKAAPAARRRAPPAKAR
jgi:DNA transformation protein and related proteins